MVLCMYFLFAIFCIVGGTKIIYRMQTKMSTLAIMCILIIWVGASKVDTGHPPLCTEI